MPDYRIHYLFLIISVLWIPGCMGLGSLQAPVAVDSPEGPSSQTPPFYNDTTAYYAANAPEWTATTPGSVVCPAPEVYAKVKRSDGGMVHPANLCLGLKVMETSGTYSPLPNVGWNFVAMYRDPSDQGIRGLSACTSTTLGTSLAGISGTALGPPVSLTTTSPSSAKQIDVYIRLLHVLPQPFSDTSTVPADPCAAWMPTGEQFLLAISQSGSANLEGENEFTLSSQNISIDPFLLYPVAR